MPDVKNELQYCTLEFQPLSFSSYRQGVFIYMVQSDLLNCHIQYEKVGITN